MVAFQDPASAQLCPSLPPPFLSLSSPLSFVLTSSLLPSTCTSLMMCSGDTEVKAQSYSKAHSSEEDRKGNQPLKVYLIAIGGKNLS